MMSAQKFEAPTRQFGSSARLRTPRYWENRELKTPEARNTRAPERRVVRHPARV